MILALCKSTSLHEMADKHRHVDCCYYLLLFFRLKTVNLVLKNTQGAESLVKLYETKLCEEEAVTADKTNIENLMGTLKVRAGAFSWTKQTILRK